MEKQEEATKSSTTPGQYEDSDAIPSETDKHLDTKHKKGSTGSSLSLKECDAPTSCSEAINGVVVNQKEEEPKKDVDSTVLIDDMDDGKVKEDFAEGSLENRKTSLSEDGEDDSECQDDSMREIVEDLEIDVPSPSTPTNKEEGTGADKEVKEGDEGPTEGQKSVKIKVLTMTELGCCEYCGGPVKKKRLTNHLRRFCSKACARAFKKPKKRDDDSGQDSEESIAAADMAGDSKMTWDDYYQAVQNKAAPDSCFRHSTIDVPGLKPGMKLEAVDRNNPPSFCVATVIRCVGHRVCIRYDGYGGDSSNDIWCNYQAEELHPIGWCAQNGYPLQSPKGVGSNLEDWRTFLTQTLTGALAAPQDLFRKGQDIFQPRVHGFEVGMKLEAVHPMKPSIICPATVTKSLGPYYFAVTPDYQHDLPSTTVCCHSDSPGIFPVGWCYRNGVELTFPANYTKKTFSWDKYLSLCRATVAPSPLFKQKVKAHRFKVGMKVEAVDMEQPSVIRVATITNVIGRLLQLFFDGQSRFQFLDVESADIYPVGWCRKTGHPLLTPFGTMPQDPKTARQDCNQFLMALAVSPHAGLDGDGFSCRALWTRLFCSRPVETDPLHLPSFDEVMGRQGATTPSSTVVLPRKPTNTRPVPEKEKCDDKDIDLDDKSGDSDISEDDSLASERFYHNKNQIFFNKSCCIGPLLDPEKVKFLPDATPPGKVSTVIRIGLEMVAKAAYNPEKVIDLMQEGCGVRVVVRHKGKLLKKAISRVDSRPKLERYLKRFCRRLICCEYFLSLKPVGQPCPDQCQADEQGNLQGPKGLKAKRSREYFEVKHLGLEKKKRGRKRKSELLGVPASNGMPLVKKMVNENGVPVVKTILPSSTMQNRTLAPAYHLQQNGTVVRPAVATGALPGVQAPVMHFQGSAASGTLTVVRPTYTSPQIAPRPPAIAPAPPNNPRLIAPATSTTVMKKDLYGHARPLVMTDMSGPPAKKSHVPTGIITNISGQRFATSSGNAGTTITFGRPPPNVTVCSSSMPPPLLVKNTDSAAITIPSVPSSMNPTSGISTSGQVSHSRGPPNVVVSSGQTVITSGGTMQMSLSEGGVPPGGTTSGAVIRAPIIVPPQVKQEGLPPPPLIHSGKIPQEARAQARAAISSAATLHGGGPSRTLGPRPPPVSTAAGFSSQYRPSFIRADGSSVTSSNQRPLLPNYKGFQSQGTGRAIPGTLQAPHGGVRPGHVSVTGGQDKSVYGHTQVAKQSVIHTIHHNPTGPSTTTHHRPVSMATSSSSSSYADVASLRKIRPGPITIVGSEQQPNLTERDPIQFECDVYDLDLEDDAEGDHENEAGEDKVEIPKKRNLWWLKKKRRKKARLTMVKPRPRRKEDGTAPSEIPHIKREPMDHDMAEHLDHDDDLTPDKTKRARLMNKEFVMRLAEDEEGAFPIGDEGDPDWDESFERKKLKQTLKKKKAATIGRTAPGKQGGAELSPSFSAPTSPFQLPNANNPYVKRVGSRLVATIPVDGPINLNSVSVQARPSTSPELLGQRAPAVPKSPRGGTTEAFCSTVGQGRSLASSQYPPRSAIRSTSSHPSVSPRSSASSRSSSGPKKSIGINTSLPGCVNGRSPDLPPNPVTWSVEHVVTWVRSTDCINYAAVFLEEEIDGQALMMLSRDALMQFTPIKLGPTLKMCSYIAQLKLRAR